jgi:KipI family sensor histidine kinase inhibitor
MDQQARAYDLGDACLCWSFGEIIAIDTSQRILALYRRLRAEKRLAKMGVRDIVPSYTALAVHIDPLCDSNAVRQYVDRLLAKPVAAARSTASGRLHVLPVIYDGEDLPRVAAITGLGAAEIVALHARATYLVAMIGFRPHFPYLLGLDKRLTTPRFDTPRLKVPAGAVAIGGEQTGVYPTVSPGGWNLIGRTDPHGLQAIAPGDQVRFAIHQGPADTLLATAADA